jgi:thiol-disulfide isomerase/thioredoxin
MAAVALLAVLAVPFPAFAGDDKGELCPVCALSGETEPHGVAATREYQGKTYSFCADHCAKAFDEEPAAYVFTPGPAPDNTLASTRGETLPVVAKGRVTLVDFWATWCKPCKKTMPKLDALYGEYRDRGVAVVGIATDTGKDREKKVKKFLEKNAVAYPVAVDREESPAWEAYHVKVLSTIYLVDRDGTVVRRWTGEVDMEDVRRALEALLAADSADDETGSGS